MFLVYSVVLHLLFPLIMVGYLQRIRAGKERWALAGERFGMATPSSPLASMVIWVHAVSVGEVVAAKPILDELRKVYPGAHIVLSTTTLTGREVALQVTVVDRVIQFPMDFNVCVWAALKRVRPNVILLIEAELWPAFIGTAHRLHIPVAVVNGRLSDKKLTTWIRYRRLLSPAVQGVSRFLMQSEQDADRVRQLGANPGTVQVIGNTKFDASSQVLTSLQRRALRQELGIPQAARVVILGSTREDRKGGLSEEEQLIPTLLAMREVDPSLHVIVAQRHIERVDVITALVPGAARRSRGEHGWFLILDTFGELADAYAAADVAFIGGSLVAWGGQSVFQPLAQGIPCCFGPHMDNQKDIAQLALRAGVAVEVPDAEGFRVYIDRILNASDDSKRDHSARAIALIKANQGVSQKIVHAVQEMLENN